MTTGKVYLGNAQRLRKEIDEALRAPLPSVTKIKLLVSDLVGQVEEMARAVDLIQLEAVNMRNSTILALDGFESRLRRLEKNIDA